MLPQAARLLPMARPSKFPLPANCHQRSMHTNRRSRIAWHGLWLSIGVKTIDINPDKLPTNASAPPSTRTIKTTRATRSGPAGSCAWIHGLRWPAPDAPASGTSITNKTACGYVLDPKRYIPTQTNRPTNPSTPTSTSIIKTTRATRSGPAGSCAWIHRLRWPETDASTSGTSITNGTACGYVLDPKR